MPGNSNGAPESPVYFVVAGSNELSLNWPTCTQPIATATAASSGCLNYHVVVQTGYGSPALAIARAITYRTDCGLFFLQRTTAGWNILPATDGDASWRQVYRHISTAISQPLRDTVSASLPPNADVLENVIVEIVANIEATGSASPQEMRSLYLASHQPVLLAEFQRSLSKTDLYLVCLGLQGSLLTGDASALSVMQQRYAYCLTNNGAWSAVLDQVKFYFGSTDATVIQSLGQIAVDTTVPADLRSATTTALVRIHTKQTLPYLGKLLADQDATLRSFAVVGMAKFANNVPVGSNQPGSGPSPYLTDATIAHAAPIEGNVAFWKDWWQQNQAALTP